MKTNIKSKSFYAEAERMQSGWGTYLRWVDVLKDKKQSNSRFTLKEFCWTLYGDGHCSSVWEDFKKTMETRKFKSKLYSNWKTLFAEWCVGR